MSKNLMVISQKVFAPAAYIAKKMNKKHKHKGGHLNLDTVQERSKSEVTGDDADDNSVTDADYSWRENKEHSPTVESVVDCPAIDEMEVRDRKPINIAYPGSVNRETLLYDSSGELLTNEGKRNKSNESGLDMEQCYAVKATTFHTAVRVSSPKKIKSGRKEQLDETYALREKVSELEKIVAQQADEIACLKSAMADNLRRLQILEESRVSSQMSNFKTNTAALNATPRRSNLTSRNRLNIDTTPVRKQNSQQLNTGHRTSSSRSSGSVRHNVNNSSPALNHLGVINMTKSLTMSVIDDRDKGLLTKSVESKSNHKARTMSRPWRPAGTPNPSSPAIYKLDLIKLNRSFSEEKSTSPPPSGVSRPKLSKRNKEAAFSKDDGSLKIYIRGRQIHFNVPTYAQPLELDSSGQVPNETLKLEWVYGYRGRDCRSNLYFLPTGEIVYFVAAVVVLYNMDEQTQRHYLGHTDDVKSIAIHPDKITIATGQVAGHSKTQGKPHVRIWSSVNLTTLHVIGLGEFERSVCCLDFSKADGGTYLCVIDEANEHVISIWQWEKERKVVEAKSSNEPVLAVDFHPLNKKSLVSCGKNHLAFWTFEDNQLSKKQAVYEKHEKPKFVLCQVFTENGELLTGDSSGDIILWNKDTYKIDKVCNGAHEGPIFSLMVTKNGTILSGGGKDRLIKEWSLVLTSSGLEKQLPDSHGAVRMLSQGPGGMVLVGTTKNCIIQMFKPGDSQTMDMRPIVEGHIEEMWGIATHPRQHRFASVGYDKLLCYWDSLTRQLIWRKEMTESMHSVCFHPVSEIIVIGCSSGRWIVIDTITREMIRVHSDGNEQIECVQFSSDGHMLALGSRDNSIYIYSVADNGTKYTRVGKCSGHSSFVTHLDWSTNGQFIRSNSGDYELLYWSAGPCRQVTSIEQVRDIDWASANCVLDWASAGIWSEGADGTDINAVAKGHQLPLLCSADDFGKVNLYSYPCPYPKAIHHQYRGHSSHVTNVQFLFDDSRIISSGGKDSSIMQWEVI